MLGPRVWMADPPRLLRIKYPNLLINHTRLIDITRILGYIVCEKKTRRARLVFWVAGEPQNVLLVCSISIYLFCLF